MLDPDPQKMNADPQPWLSHDCHVTILLCPGSKANTEEEERRGILRPDRGGVRGEDVAESARTVPRQDGSVY